MRALYREGKLPKAVENRRHELESLGFLWNPKDLLEERFIQTVKELEAHFRKNGNYRITDLKFKAFTDKQRTLRKKGELDKGREAMLDAINFPWDPQTERWEDNFEAWRESMRTGTKLSGSQRSWLSNQITELSDAEKRNNNPVLAERYRLLTEAGLQFGLKQAQEDATWDRMFSEHLIEQQTGQKGSEKLQNWKVMQRQKYWNGTLREDRKMRLIASNFHWGNGPKGTLLP